MRTEEQSLAYREHRTIEGGIETIYVEGPKGVKRIRIATTSPKKESQVQEMIRGVVHGYKDKLTIKGVGYRAEQTPAGQIELSLGYRAPIKMGVPTGIEVKVKGAGTIIEATSSSKQNLRQYLSKIIAKRPASKDKYNGKGVEK